MEFLQFAKSIPVPEPEIIFRIFGYSIANSTLFALLITVIFVLFCFSIRKFKSRPDAFQALVEIFYEGILDFITTIIGSKEKATKALPAIGALLLFIGVSNLASLIPGISSITYHEHEVFRVPTTDFNTTFGLAFGSVIFLQVISVIDFGFFGYLGKFFKFKDVVLSFKKGLGEGALSIVHFFVGILEFIGEFTRIISLSFRLFGNMYAHEVLAIVILGALAWLLPSVWMAFGILVGVVQAVVFSSLVAVYYSLSIKGEESHAHV